MLGAECLFPDRQGAHVGGLGFGEAALIMVELGQVVQALRNVWMLGAECLFPDRQRAFVRRLSLGIAALHSIELSQVI